MNVDSFSQLLQTGFRLTLGATASLIEIAQDPQKRSERLDKLRQEWQTLADEWVTRGESTEAEARAFVNSLINRQNQAGADYRDSATASTAQPSASPEIQTEIQELTNQIASMRAELERLRNQD
jgi:polyhydroxyalkanoate synthesis regulator phasin